MPPEEIMNPITKTQQYASFWSHTQVISLTLAFLILILSLIKLPSKFVRYKKKLWRENSMQQSALDYMLSDSEGAG